ncbi:MAG: enoyl-CoA hydratase-related protein, partial [Planctomycetota bacterium]|nr:enoyl-CoA hydratase-related protein [Planctomycetota bacterium]
VSLGIIPGYGGTQRLPRIIGKGRALEMILTARMVKADEAMAMGLVNGVFSSADLLGEVENILRTVLSHGPVAIRMALDAVNHGAEMPLGDGLNYEATFFGLLSSTEDVKEGMQAFVEKRPADFKNR